MENSNGSNEYIFVTFILTVCIVVGILTYIKHIKNSKKLSTKKKLLECAYCIYEMDYICEKCKDPICYSHSKMTNTGQRMCFKCRFSLENNWEENTE